MNTREALAEQAENLYWTWQPDIISVFRDLDPQRWREATHNPCEFLEMFSDEELEDRARDLGLESRINYVKHRLEDYNQDPETWGAFHAGTLRARPVAYFSAEFGIHESLPIYSGGLGVLAGDHLKAASDLDLPLVGVGLLYANGYFKQTVDRDGRQHEEPLDVEVANLPLALARDENGAPRQVHVRTRTSEIALNIWTADVGRSRLLLLDSNVAENSEEDRRLTATLYGGGTDVRIRQELILGVGGLRALAELGIRPGVLHLNEGHSAFAVLEMSRMLRERDGCSFQQARLRTSGMTVFTTHTPVDAGHDRFRPELMEETLGPLRERLELSERDFMGLGRVDPQDDDEPFCPTVLGIEMSQFTNGVSALHGRVARSMWTDLWPQLHSHDVPIGHITNGVHVASWLAMDMKRLYDRYLRDDWQDHQSDPQTWVPIRDIEDDEFWEQHQILKQHLCDYVERRLRAQRERRDEPLPEENPEMLLDPDALTIGFARRFVPYKRVNLLLDDLDRLARIVDDDGRPVQFIFSGKAHPADDRGKELIGRLFEVSRDERFFGKIVFIEDYNINVARHLVQGVDVWLNTPRRPLEACGSSGQKVLFNGGLNLSILDGWWAEAYDGENGFAVGDGGEHVDSGRQDDMDKAALFEVLERDVIPMFYDRDEDGLPRKWIRRQKRAITSLAWKFNARRMVLDYARNYYLPAAGACTAWPCTPHDS